MMMTMLDTEWIKNRRTLSTFDAACIMVGIIIGAGIYKTTPLVAASSGSTAWLLGVWLFGGGLALVGALCYAELAMTVTQEGGEYAYLRKAYGDATGSFFAWMEFWIIRPGSTGSMAMVFGEYANYLTPLSGDPVTGAMVYAVLVTLTLLGLNLGGLKAGKWTQNTLTVFKVLALLVLVVGSLFAFWISPELLTAQAKAAEVPAVNNSGQSMDGFLLAMVMVMFTYGGWNDLSYVAAEVKEPAKNIPRALLLGVFTVTAIYVLINIAMLMALGRAGLAASEKPATEMLKMTRIPEAENIMNLLICITALGAVNGMMFTSARIYHAVGRQIPAFGWLGRWNTRRNVPVRSLVLQSVVVLAMVIGFGMRADGFKLLVLFVSPFMWTFLIMIGSALLVFRYKGMVRSDAYRTPLFPLLPGVFILSSMFMAYRSADFFLSEVQRLQLLDNAFFIGLSIATGLAVLSGFVVAWISRRKA